MESVHVRSAHPELLAQICRALDEKKAEDLHVLHVAHQSSITDYLVIATGTSDPHLRALRVELEKVIDASKNRIVGMDTGLQSGWLVVDVFDIMVHVLTRENRSRYALERLWKDATPLSIAKILNPNFVEPTPEPVPARTAAPVASAPKAKAKKQPAKKMPTAAKSKTKVSAKTPAKKAAKKSKPAAKTKPKAIIKASAKKSPAKKAASKTSRKK